MSSQIILLLVGLSILSSGLLGLALHDNPLVNEISFVDGWFEWAFSNIIFLIPIGSFLALMSVDMNFIRSGAIALIIGIIIYLLTSGILGGLGL